MASSSTAGGLIIRIGLWWWVGGGVCFAIVTARDQQNSTENYLSHDMTKQVVFIVDFRPQSSY